VKIGLIHNRGAGDALGLEDLTQAIHQQGHEVAGVATMADGLDALPLDRIDLVAAAGGDGTIAAVAKAMAGSLLPIGILAMGTANNIALSLGVPLPIGEAIASWSSARPRPLDLGVATGPWGERRFVESVGGGLVTHGIVVMDRQDETSPTTDQQLARALEAHGDVLGLADAVEWRLTLDGQPLAGQFVLVEVLNIGAIGPNLTLTPAASPWDGRLTVVAATLDDRHALASYLRSHEAGIIQPPTLPTWHVREVTIEAGDRLHVDDEVVGEPGPMAARLRVEPGAVRVLVPESPVHLAERAPGDEADVALPTMGSALPIGARRRRGGARKSRQ
jgi:diacylglycerol kinase family enzyme